MTEISKDMREHIETRLAEVEASEGVRVLFAAESGSRAWGFASPDSDYDVRFVYAHPTEWYVSLSEQRDVIERDLDDRLVDLAGWDIRKAMRLLLKSNAALYEWTRSPILYRDGPGRTAIQRLFEKVADSTTLAMHYAHTADGQWRRAIAGREEVKLKKYFYVMRPLLAHLWIETFGTPPPMETSGLLAAVPLPDEVSRAFSRILERKSETAETSQSARVAALDRWIEDQLSRIQKPAIERAAAIALRQEAGMQMANEVFRELIGFTNREA